MRAIDSKVPTSYAEALDTLNGKTQRFIGNNTRLVQYVGEGKIALHLHSTDVVIYRRDGSIELNSGGWRSLTTKARMNAALRGVGATVYQHKHEWRVRLAGHSDHSYFDGYTIHS